MNIGKIAKFLFFLFLCFFSVCKAESINDVDFIVSKGYLVMGTCADFSPFEFLKDGKVVGIDPDIVRQLADSLGVDLKIRDTSFSSLVAELNNGTVDLIASGFTRMEEREKNLDFSDSYFTASQKIVVKNDSPIKKVEDINDKKIGVQLGTTGDSYCTDLKSMEVIRYDKMTDAIAALSSGIVDAVVMDNFSADQILRKSDFFCTIDETLTEESYCIGIRKGSHSFLEFINEKIRKMKQNGEIEKIVSLYTNISETESGDSVSSGTSKASELMKAEYFQYILKGLAVTLVITFFAMIVGVSLGTFASSLRIISQSNKNLKIFDLLVNFYTTVVRGTPVIVQLFIIYYIILAGISKNPMIAAVVTLGINSGAYVCEHIRAGIEAINKGQFEAGRALGLSEKTLMLKIIIPQAIKNILPSLAGEAISLLKETAAVGFIGVMDLALAGKRITSITFDHVLPLFVVAIIYLILVIGLTFVLRGIERKMKTC